jgi:hypothetical protein
VRVDPVRALANGLRALLSPWLNEITSHFISGPLLDPITGAFALLGLALALRRPTRPPFAWIWAWLLLAVLATGAAAPYPEPPNTRTFFILPPLILLAALAFGRLLVALRPRRQAVVFVLAATVALLIIGLNLHRLHFETPARVGLIPEAVAVIASEQHGCRFLPAPPLFLADDPLPVLSPLVAAYGWRPAPALRKAPGGLADADLDRERCLIALAGSGAAPHELQSLAGRTGARPRWARDGNGTPHALFLHWRPEAR